MVRHLFILLSIAISMAVSAQNAGTSTAIFHDAFHTLQVKVDGSDQAVPIIELNSDQHLTISFDEIADDLRYMRYRILHCDMYWQPDRLVESEYLNGFNEARIDDYQFSQATTIHYVHYSITLPNADMTPILSGNYLLQVYDEEQPDDTLLQVRFSIVEPLTAIEAKVSSRTDIDYNLHHQQLDVAVDLQSLDVFNPINDIQLMVSQNSRTDNHVIAGRPSRTSGPILYYEHNPALIFPAANEYRRMEIVSTNYPGMRVEGYTYADPYYHATLFTDLPRATEPYSYDRTQHGRFRIREFNSDHPDTEADYIMTHFALRMPLQWDYDIYLDGDFTLRQFSPQALMVYNHDTQQYENTTLLKQGAYNYQYLAVPHRSHIGSTAPIEGDNYQTINEYLIKVYYRKPGQRYDRLIGYDIIYSGI